MTTATTTTEAATDTTEGDTRPGFNPLRPEFEQEEGNDPWNQRLRRYSDALTEMDLVALVSPTINARVVRLRCRLRTNADIAAHTAELLQEYETARAKLLETPIRNLRNAMSKVELLAEAIGLPARRSPLYRAFGTLQDDIVRVEITASQPAPSKRSRKARKNQHGEG